jgi:hypothetical protein
MPGPRKRFIVTSHASGLNIHVMQRRQAKLLRIVVVVTLATRSEIMSFSLVDKCSDVYRLWFQVQYQVIVLLLCWPNEPTFSIGHDTCSGRPSS